MVLYCMEQYSIRNKQRKAENDLERLGEKLHHPWEKARPYMGIKISLCRDVTVRETIELVGPFSKEVVSRFL